jgi:hypothetical protein
MNKEPSRWTVFCIVSIVPVTLGWIWFAVMVFFKFSGATIYATTEPAIIRQMDVVWEEATKTKLPERPGFNFHAKVQGVKWEESLPSGGVE